MLTIQRPPGQTASDVSLGRSVFNSPELASSLPHTRRVVNEEVLVVVGNGLSIDLRQRFPRLREWDTQRPLSWRVDAPDRRQTPLIDLLPRAQRHIADARSVDPTLTDFEVFDAALRAVKPTSDFIQTVVELRHLVALSFAEYQTQADRFVTALSWPWFRFFESIADRIHGVVSYNYDLNVETMIQACGRRMSHLALNDGTSGLAIFKPHGSIDYVPAPNVIGGPKPGYPLQIFMEMNDVPIVQLPRHGLRVPRYAADVVIPSEASGYSEFQWVAPGRSWLRSAGRNTSVLLVLGLSYWEVDRQEIDEVIESVVPTAKVVVADPFPKPELLRRLNQRFAQVVEWRCGPESLP